MDERRTRFEAEVLPHLDAAYRFARWLSYSPADAQDVVQDAMLWAYRGFDGLRASDARTWLLAIVRNCSQIPGPKSVAPPRGDARTLDRLIAELPEDQRTVLMLREVEEMDYAQIASITNVPIGTVMSRLARARAALNTRWLGKSEESACAVR